jgi:CRP/FNR family cyclic AMP-dependent transcriptional regulator
LEKLLEGRGDRVNFFGTNLTFQPYSDKDLDALICQNSIRIDVPAKKIFLMPGDNIDYIYYLKQGQTKHYMVNPDGLEKVLYKLTPGWLFGETAFFLGHSTGLHSQAETDLVLRKIEGPVVRRLFRDNQLFAQYVVRNCCSKLLILRYEIENLTFNSCKNRIKRFFAASVDKTKITDTGWYNVKVHSTHYELGIIVGAARVTVSKLINELCDERFLRVINRNIQVNINAYEEYMIECECE